MPTESASLSLRLRLAQQARIGPGKVALLEALDQAESVAQAGAQMDMSARRAWLLIDSLNRAFEQPVVRLSNPDSPAGSEARLTDFGRQLIVAYRAVETDAKQAVEQRFANILKHLKPDDEPSA